VRRPTTVLYDFIYHVTYYYNWGAVCAIHVVLRNELHITRTRELGLCGRECEGARPVGATPRRRSQATANLPVGGTNGGLVAVAVQMRWMVERAVATPVTCCLHTPSEQSAHCWPSVRATDLAIEPTATGHNGGLCLSQDNGLPFYPPPATSAA